MRTVLFLTCLIFSSVAHADDWAARSNLRQDLLRELTEVEATCRATDTRDDSCERRLQRVRDELRALGN